MYKTEITTREDIQVAIDIVSEAVENTTLGSEQTNPYNVKMSITEAEIVVNVLEICANKFPDKSD